MKTFLRHIRRTLRAALDRDVFLRPTIDLPSERHGSDYGGWVILADSLQPSAHVISAGLGHDLTFDLSVIGKYGCHVIGYDPDPKAYAFHDHSQFPKEFEWRKQGWGARTSEMKMFRPPRQDWVSGTIVEGAIRHSSEYDFVEIRDIAEVLHETPGDIDLVKMDIEGAEYAVIDRLIESGVIHRVKQLLIEFHHGARYRGSDTKRCVENIRRAGFELFFVSDIGCEFSFCRIDQCALRG